MKLTAAAAVAASLALAACGASPRPPAAGTGGPLSASSPLGAGAGAVAIGFFGPLTGPHAQFGTDVESGERLAVARYDGGRPVRPVTVDPFNSQGQVSEAANGVAKLVHDRVVAVVGPILADEGVAAGPLLEAARLPSITVSPGAEAPASGWRYSHRSSIDDATEGRRDGDYLVRVLGERQVAVLDDGTTYGSGLADHVAAEVGADDGHVAAAEAVDPNAADYGPVVSQIVASGAPALFFGGYYDAAARLLRQLRAAGYKGQFMAGDGVDDPEFLAAAGPSAEGAYLSCACADETDDPAAASFESAYKAMFGASPGPYSAEAYDATNLVLAALSSGDATPEAVQGYLGANGYRGLTGTLRFQPDGDLTGGALYMYRVESGRIVSLGSVG